MRGLSKIAPDATESQGDAAWDGAMDTVGSVGDSGIGLRCDVYSGTSENGQYGRGLGLLKLPVDDQKTGGLLTGDRTSEGTWGSALGGIAFRGAGGA